MKRKKDKAEIIKPTISQVEQAAAKQDEMRARQAVAKYEWSKELFFERPECPECDNYMVEERYSNGTIKNEMKLDPRAPLARLYIGYRCKNNLCKQVDKLRVEIFVFQVRRDRNGDLEFKRIYDKADIEKHKKVFGVSGRGSILSN